VQPVGCFGEMEIVRDRHKIAKLPGIEHGKPPDFIGIDD
jgi:hypothetical protein